MKTDKENITNSFCVQDMLDLSVDLICFTDFSGKFIKLSKSWKDTLGYELDELENHNFIDFVHPDDQKETIAKMELIGKNDTITSFVNRYRTKSGEYKSIEWNLRTDGRFHISIARDVTEKKKFEGILKETNWFLEQSQKIANIGSFNFDIRGNKWTSTSTLDEIYGIDSTFERTFEGWLSIVDPDFQKKMLDYFTNDVLIKKMPFDKEYVIRKVDTGEKRWVHGKGTIFYDDNEIAVNMIGTIQDIHEQKVFDEHRQKMETRLYEEKERFNIMFQSIGDGIISTDDKEQIVYINKSAENLTGWTGNDTIGKSFEDVFVINNEKTGKKQKNLIHEVLTSNAIFEMGKNTILTSKDGKKYHVADSTAPIRDLAGKIVGAVMVFRDVTERKKSELLIKQGSEIIEKMQTGIYIYQLEDFNNDASLKLISANAASISIIGIKKDEIIGKYIDEIFPNLRASGIPEKFADVVRTGVSFETEEFSYDDNNIMNSCFSFKALRIQENQVCILFDDITEKKKYIEKIEFISLHDILTGIDNRTYLTNKLPEIDQEEQLPIAVILGDVNGLKLINDVYGHKTGDDLLKKIASILTKACPDYAIISRWGGDEFKIIIPHTTTDEANAILHKIKTLCLAESVGTVVPNISLGVCVKMTMSENIEDILHEAENRMYTHKLVEGKSIRNSIITSLQKSLFEKSRETEEHSKRLTLLTSKMAEQMQLSQPEIDEMNLLTTLHDIGKMGISNQILNKAGALTVKEWYEVKKHPETGYRIAQAITELSRISDLILNHHEHWDGSGYPNGLKGENIPRISRILAVIDAYDVMTSVRPYKSPMSKEQALAELEKHAGTQFDPAVVKEFVLAMKKIN